MPRTLVAFALLFATSDVSAQTLLRVSNDAVRPSALRVGVVAGVVRDQTGALVGGVSIVALGDTVAAARSDGLGKFSLALPPGEYVLRVTRTGYLSTYREAIRVHSRTRVEREITLVRQHADEPQRVNQAGLNGAAPPQPSNAPTVTHAHSEAAWRLRHLPRSVLRDAGAAASMFASDDAPPRPPRSIFDRAFGGSARLAGALLRNTGFTGQVNFLTTSALDSASGWLPETWPRSIAYFSIGSAAGVLGDWQMRGAVGGGDRASWALVGEYQSPRDADHVVRTGVSYSAQGSLPRREDRLSAARPAARSVAGVYVYDRWSSGRSSIDYGARLDRYDYIATPELFSPRIDGRVGIIGRFYVAGTASQRMIAPGADEFLPPVASGPWLPPERTFSSIVHDRPLEAERVRHIDAGVGREFGRDDRPRRLVVRTFHQTTANQIATLFGQDDASGIGHYYVATPGSVALSAWAVHGSGRVTRHVDAAIDYSVADARWALLPDASALRGDVPSVVRASRERLHDLTAVLEANIPETSTRVTFTYRVNSAFSQGKDGPLPVGDGRFDLQVRQALPYQPIRGGTLEILVAARTLFRELTAGGSFYDELLTVSAPLRLMGGVQVRF